MATLNLSSFSVSNTSSVIGYSTDATGNVNGYSVVKSGVAGYTAAATVTGANAIDLTGYSSPVYDGTITDKVEGPFFFDIHVSDKSNSPFL